MTLIASFARPIARAALLLACLMFIACEPALAQDTNRADSAAPPQASVIIGRIETNDFAAYRLSDLPADVTLSVYAERTGGNLDPTVYLLDGAADIEAIGSELRATAVEAAASGEDPLAAVAQLADALTLAWDDDSGAGHDATFSYAVSEPGDYLLVVAGAAASDSFGDYRLLAGINTPMVAAGEAADAAPLAMTLERPTIVRSVQEITGTLTLTEPVAILRLVNLNEGDTLVAEANSLANAPAPSLILEDFGGKPLAAVNLAATEEIARLEYTFPESALNYQLVLESGAADGAATESTFLLRLARNEETAAAGGVTAPPIIEAPIPAHVTLQIDQITNVDQVAENFSVVASAIVRWQDPALAFSSDSCQCTRRLFRSERVITNFLTDNNINAWPQIILFNQQGARNSQTPLLAVETDGSAIYYERFTATLQAPDFDFRQFPFDVQTFHVRIQSLFENDTFRLVAELADSGFGEQLGEEQWIFSNDTFTSEIVVVDDRDQVDFRFTTQRHLDYYLFRIFLPVLLIILVSWITFFLGDYGRRIEVTSGNLLLFIAWNFTVAGELPRLGYLTFLDVVLISTFVISTLVIIVNVWFRRLERQGRTAIAEKWDAVLIWIYPLLYLIGGFVVYLWFFRPWE